MVSVASRKSLERRARAQWGLFSTRQAVRSGLSRPDLTRLCSRGEVERIRQGVYAFPDAPADHLMDLRATWISLGGVSPWSVARPVGSVPVVSGQSAAELHGVGDLVPARMEFTTTTSRQTTLLDVSIRRRKLAAQDIVSLHGLPVTSLPRTIRDLAQATVDGDHLAGVVQDALQGTAVTLSEVTESLSPYARAYGFSRPEGLLRQVLGTT